MDKYNHKCCDIYNKYSVDLHTAEKSWADGPLPYGCWTCRYIILALPL